MHWGGLVFAALVIVLAIPFVLSHLRAPDSPLRIAASKTLVAAAALAALSLVIVNAFRALGMLENHSAYWTLNIGLAVLFWVMLLRLAWTERRQRPR